jgi:DNA invertase Pin-like site-specific DNA recombinase
MSDERNKTAIYARYSSHSQDQGTSVEVQLDHCRRAAGDACREYVDRAVTGTTMSRAEFDRMIDDCEAGLIDTIYVYKWDRFGRSARAHTVIADLEELSVKVISATEGHDPLGRGIQLVVAEDYSRKLSERVTEAKRKRFNEGCWNGGTQLYGYRAEKKRLTPDWGGEAEVVAWIFETYLHDNIGFKQIARQLNARGIKPRKAKHWAGGSIRTMLSNTTYAGRPCYNGDASPRKMHRSRFYQEGEGRAERPDEMLRIVPDEVFDAVQAKMRNRKSFRPIGHNQTRKFSRLITCGVCGATFVRRFKARSEQYAAWACGTRVRVDKQLCANHHSIREVRLVAMIDATMRQVIQDTESIVEEAVAEARKLVGGNREELRKNRDKIAAIDLELNRLAERLMDPDLSEPATKRLLSKQVAEKTEEREQLQARQAELAEDANDNTDRLADAVRQAINEAKQSLAQITSDSELNQFVKDFIGEMVVEGDGSIRPKLAAGPRDQAAEAVQYRRLDRKL